MKCIIKEVTKYTPEQDKDAPKSDRPTTYWNVLYIDEDLQEFKSPITEEAYNIALKHSGTPSVYEYETKNKSMKNASGQSKPTPVFVSVKYIKEFKLAL